MLGWVLLWTGLVLGAVAVLGALAVGVVRRGIAVARELARAGERVGEVAARVEQLPPPTPPTPTVLRPARR
ncbi:hypothetical protein [Quadrisphaera sp. DSM 44207]|uniref:hypothetical protein n=1 Tax=Quadrisphaera sp. DSM 44207 TaxID=1881057 RepID=UPI00089263B9|nr:hypothetical protein [Quadrisphaera sp. DSM 44207]SDQ40151.1 hypothetical protein SAMN05428996_1557 [Quadrisphaera sp. DSM 44207]